MNYGEQMMLQNEEAAAHRAHSRGVDEWMVVVVVFVQALTIPYIVKAKQQPMWMLKND